jgi:hypothetical protein
VTDSFWLDDNAASLPLDGTWEFQLGDAPPHPITVPGAWEARVLDKTTDGPARYRRTFTLPDHWLDSYIRLEAEAISYHAVVRVNGQLAGAHTGMWSPFQLDVAPFVRVGQNEIEIEVWKPGHRFPVRSTLAGFLPDVCNTFGGIWQSLRLRAFGDAAFTGLRLHADHTGHLRISGKVWSARPITHVRAAAGGATAQVDVRDGRFSLELALTGVPRWEPEAPDARLVPVTVSAHSGEDVLAARTQRLGFRSLRADGERTHFNGQPFHFRGVLDWGWNPDTVAPIFTPETIRENFAKARALGFNLWKLCLYVPGETFFDAADEMGMPLWLEMPLWLPRVTPEFKARTLREYESIFRRLHHHPSIAVVSLGCELNAQADADYLRALHALAREWFPNALLCDNSGSAEAYGGVDVPLSDFRDYHFYADPHFFEPLIQHFSRSYRAVKPWLYGEFCDADTLRDYSALPAATWWLHTGTTEHPDTRPQREHRARLAAAGISDGGRALTGIARKQATAIRKHLLELVRRHHASGGYVVTGWRDTPIATSGMVDDALQLKFDTTEWRRFNSDVVLVIDRERRRRWEGGDRPSPRDPYTGWQGERVALRMIVSNGGGGLEIGELAWSVTRADGEPVTSGTLRAETIPGGTVTEIGVIEFVMPVSDRPVELTLQATLTVETGRWPVASTQNQWSLWAIPQPALPPLIALEPPLLHRHHFDAIGRTTQFTSAADARPGQVIVAGELTGALIARVRDGARVLLWLTQPDSRFTVNVPFWREAIHVFEPHPLWDHAPHPGHADMRFFSLATDFAIDPTLLSRHLSPSRAVWRRFDARQLTWADYVCEAALGSGHLLITTLRLEGGLGSQPVTFPTNPWGAWLFAALVNHLSKMKP